MQVHFIYVKGNRISAPFSITNELFDRLSKIWEVKVYDWSEQKTIMPQKGDILIGHPHPWSDTIFRRSMKQKGWERVIAISPFHHSIPKYCAYLNNVYNYIDTYVAICGEYWMDTIGSSLYAHFEPITHRLDLAVNRKHFPHIKSSFNEKGKRKFLYIGSAYDAKGTDYLAKISLAKGDLHIGWIGHGDMPDHHLQEHGFLDTAHHQTLDIIKDYDFLISPGRSDANPTTILESLSWGLIPVCTKESGYYKKNWLINIPLDQVEETLNILNKLNWLDPEELINYQSLGKSALENNYNWDNLCNQVVKVIQEPKKKKPKLKLKDFKNISLLTLISLGYNFSDFLKSKVIK